MTIITNYTTQGVDYTTGKTGSFFIDRWFYRRTGLIRADPKRPEVYPDLVAFYDATNRADRINYTEPDPVTPVDPLHVERLMISMGDTSRADMADRVARWEESNDPRLDFVRAECPEYLSLK